MEDDRDIAADLQPQFLDRAADPEDDGRMMVFDRNPNAYWLDDYEEVICDYPANLPYRSHGPE